MENNGSEQWDPTILPQWENLYVYLGIFHGLIAKKPIPWRSDLDEYRRLIYGNVTDFSLGPV